MLEKLIASIDALTAAILSLKGTSLAAAAPAAATTKEEKSPKPAKTDEPITLTTLRDAASALVKAGRQAEVKKMLNDTFSVAALSALKEEQFPNVLAALKKLSA